MLSQPTAAEFPYVFDPKRLCELSSLRIMDTQPEFQFDRLTNLASVATGAPLALMSLVDDHRQWFKSAIGLVGDLDTSRQTELSHSFCAHVVESRQPLIVYDASTDPLVMNNGAFLELNIKAYLVYPILLDSGTAIGSLCALDVKPRDWQDRDLHCIKAIAEIAADLIDRGIV